MFQKLLMIYVLVISLYSIIYISFLDILGHFPSLICKLNHSGSRSFNFLILTVQVHSHHKYSLMILQALSIDIISMLSVTN